MSEFLGLQALRRVELHLEAQARVRSAPLTVDALVLIGVPEVLQLDQLEPLCLEPVDVSKDTVSVTSCVVVGERVSHPVGHQVGRFPDRGAWRFHGSRDLFLEAVFALQHVVKARQATARAGCLYPADRREGDLVGLVAEVGARFAGFGVLFGGEPAVAVCRPAAVGLGVRSRPGPFWKLVFVLFPGGPQVGDRVSPCLSGGGLVGGVGGAVVAGVLGDLLLSEGCGVRPVARFRAGRCFPAGRRFQCGGGLAGTVGRVGVGIDGHCSPPAAVGAW
jgi:hypothetical protein